MIRLLNKNGLKNLLPKISKNLPILLSLLAVGIFGTVLSFGAFWSIKNQLAEDRKATFVREAEFYLNTVEKRFQSVENFIESIDRLLLTNPNLSRDEYAVFNNDNDLYELGILAVSWSPIITAEERTEFVIQTRKTGIFDFDIRDLGDGYNPTAPIRERYAPILFVEPIHHSGHIQGLDLYPIQTNVTDLNHAIDHGHFFLSEFEPLSIEDTGELGVWLHLPIYKKLSSNPTIKERRENLRGFVSAVILASDLFTSPKTSSEMDFELLISVGTRGNDNIFHTLAKRVDTLETSVNWQIVKKFAQSEINFGFKRLDLEEFSLRNFLPWIALLIGLVATTLLTAYIISSALRTRRIAALVKRRTLDLKQSYHRLRGEIEEREKAKNEQNRAEIRYDRIFANAVEGIFAIDTKGKIVNANPSFAIIFGFQHLDELKNKHADFNDLILPTDRRRFQSLLIRKQNVINLECRAIKSDGSNLWLSVNASYVNEESNIMVEGTVVDITERKLAEEQLNNFAYHDPLTNCLNRRAFNELLENRFIKATNTNNWDFALLFIDLDHFKMINDTQGHDVGDLVIQEVAKRLSATLRESSSIARLGGDEFAVMLDNIETSGDVFEISTRILNQLSRPYTTKDRPFLTSGSIGIAHANQLDSNTPAQLMRNADLAMYQAKRSGRNKSVVYSHDFHEEADEKLKLQNALRNVIETDELSMAYQPVVDLRDANIIAGEALIRWNSPIYGHVSPASFIPLAEKMGLISDIGAWCIDRVLSDISSFKDNDALSNLRVNINLSPIQLCQSDFFDYLVEKCAHYGVAHHRVALELTETAMADDHSNVMHYLSQLKTAGFKILVDDFGTGYASLNQLITTNWSGIKIDRNFVEGLEADKNKLGITRAVLSMADAMNYEVTAEGIETEKQRQLLIELGCTVGQGYLFGKPMPLQEFLTLALNDTRLSNISFAAD